MNWHTVVSSPPARHHWYGIPASSVSHCCPTSLLQFSRTTVSTIVLQLGPWILLFFYKQAPLSIKSQQGSISGARNSQRGLITGFLVFIFINFGWFARRNKPSTSISTPSAYLSPSLKCQYIKWLPLYLLVSSKWKTFQKQYHIELHALSSVTGTVATAWVRNKCQMGGKTYHREGKIEESNFAYNTMQPAVNPAILVSEEEQQ